jgi:RimJ/RimL family protein N-acetyltransferase
VTNIVIGEHVSRWVVNQLGGVYTGAEVGIGLEKNGELIAGVSYYQYNGRSIAMSIAAKGKRWANRNYLHAIFAYPLRQLKLNKVLALIDSENVESMRFAQKLGAKREATIEGAGKFGDMVVWSMSLNHCKWL